MLLVGCMDNRIIIPALLIVVTIYLSIAGCTTSQVPPFREELYNIADGSNVHGSFGLWYGYIDTEEVYYYYTKNAHEAYILKHFNADKTEIYMDEDSAPYALIYGCYSCYHPKNGQSYRECRRANESLPLVDDTFEPIQQEWICEGDLGNKPRFESDFKYDRVELHIPRESIVKHYTLDAQL